MTGQRSRSKGAAREKKTNKQQEADAPTGSPPLFRRYVDACHSLGLEPDTCILSCLATEYPHVSVSDAVTPGSWLPLLHALDLENHAGTELDSDDLEAAHMARLDLQSLTIHYPADTHSDDSILHYDVDMRLLRDLLTLPACGVRTVKLTNLRISDAGLVELGGCVESSTCLVSLDISHANIGATCSHEAISKFAEVLTHNVTLQHLDVSNNWLGFDMVEEFTRAVRQRPVVVDGKKQNKDNTADASASKGGQSMHGRCHHSHGLSVTVDDHGNIVLEEVLSSVTHGLGALLSVIGTIVLLYNSMGDRRKFWASAVYGMGLFAMFACSSIFHGFFLHRKYFTVLQLIDHCGIYLMIAGSYFPFMLVGLVDSPSAPLLAVLQWVCALLGIVFALYEMRYSSPYKQVVELTLYLLMGFMAAFNWSEMSAHLEPMALELLVWGGACFTFGVVFFLLESKHPIFHVVWHMCVLAGAAFHYFAILIYVIGLDELNVLDAQSSPPALGIEAAALAECVQGLLP